MLLNFFATLVGWHASTVSFPLSDVILAKLACPLSDNMFYLHSRITNLSLKTLHGILKTHLHVCAMDKLYLTGQNLGRVFNSESDYVDAGQGSLLLKKTA